MPLKSHLEAIYNIFAYVGKFESSKMMLDYKTPMYDKFVFLKHIDIINMVIYVNKYLSICLYHKYTSKCVNIL